MLKLKDVPQSSVKKAVTVNYHTSMGYYNEIKDQRLNPIPSNAIIYKALTGIGATTAEIKAARNSIIVLPNVPVILSKQAKHGDLNNTFAVIEGVTTDDVVSYLIRKDKLPKKILTTPESFMKKVIGAFKRTSLNMYSSYFMLFDESHKYVLDNDYRKEIIEPFEHFFLFKQKAIISATPLNFSDPRFSQQNFSRVTINPVYDIKKDIVVVHTNNISHALEVQFDERHNTNYCIFYNSIDGIKCLIKSLSLEEDSTIFCSAFSARELKIEGYKEVYSTYNKGQTLTKYSFFTSSFYNGLDIELDSQPNLIMITSVKFADHTIIDPYTDTVQIVGRFRNSVRSIVHITDTNDKLNYLKPQEVVEQVNISAQVYKAIGHLKSGAPNPFAQQLYSEALTRIRPYFELLNASISNDPVVTDGEQNDAAPEPTAINHFKLDNYFYNHKVRSYYSEFGRLIEAYENTRRFNVSHEIVYQKITKEDILKRFGNRRTSPDVYRDVSNILNEIEGLREIDLYEFERQSNIYQNLFSPIYNAYVRLGAPVMAALKFNHRTIQREVIKYDAVRLINMHPVFDAVYNEIPKGSRVPSAKIKLILQEIYNSFAIKKNAKATDIEEFYTVRKNVKVKVVRNKKVEWPRGYEMLEPLHNLHKLYKRS